VSITAPMDRKVRRAITEIGDQDWTSIKYPKAV
jgi:hypothetical protein